MRKEPNMFTMHKLFFILTCALTSLLPAAEKPGVHLIFSLTKDDPDKLYTITVSGKITDAQTGKPIKDAHIKGILCRSSFQDIEPYAKYPSQETQSDKEGNYHLRFITPLTITGLGKGEDHLCISAGGIGYETIPQWINSNITPQKTTFPEINFALNPGKLIKGKVVDEKNKPVAGALIYPGNGLSGTEEYFRLYGETQTDENGGFNLWIGNIRWLVITKRNYGFGVYWDFDKKNSMRKIVLPSCGTITGRVIDINGKGVPHCEVSVHNMMFDEINKVLTDREGKYELKGVPGNPSLREFYKRKNKSYMDEWGNLTVYARSKPQKKLRDVPQYTIQAEDGKTVKGPDLVIGLEASVSGKLIPSKTAFGLKGLLVRLDYDWGYMVEADADGKYLFPNVRPGKHRLTAYLPNNLRGDRGIGHAEINLEPGKSLVNVQIQLETLTEVRVQILDAGGNPLEGITAGATWRKDGNGFWTEGAKSDKDGWAVLLLYPGDTQYVRGFDFSRKLVSEGFEEVNPKIGQIIDHVRITMVSTASLSGLLPVSFKDKRLVAHLKYADGNEDQRRLKLDPSGRFELEGLTPGIAKVTIETYPIEFTASLESSVEIKPGGKTDVGPITFSKINFFRVTGKLLPSPTFSNLEGFKIRLLDLKGWEPMIPTDKEGRFTLEKVPAGKHRIIAYLPFNLRTDRGVGHIEIDVPNKNIDNVQLPLETLATLHVQITDQEGKPLEGIAAAAWWTADHSGVFTEGSPSDKNGKAVLYLYPNDLQYVGAHDWSRKFLLKGHKEFTLKPGEVINDFKVIMIPSK